jgi:hypothetical protein
VGTPHCEIKSTGHARSGPLFSTFGRGFDSRRLHHCRGTFPSPLARQSLASLPPPREGRARFGVCSFGALRWRARSRGSGACFARARACFASLRPRDSRFSTRRAARVSLAFIRQSPKRLAGRVLPPHAARHDLGSGAQPSESQRESRGQRDAVRGRCTPPPPPGTRSARGRSRCGPEVRRDAWQTSHRACALRRPTAPTVACSNSGGQLDAGYDGSCGPYECGRDQICIHPWYGAATACPLTTVPDGGCRRPLIYVARCADGSGPGCVLDGSPYCQDALPSCAASPSCDSCAIDGCPCGRVNNRDLYCCDFCPAGQSCATCATGP